MSATDHDRLPRVLMPLNLDPSQKFGTLEEQVFSLARAFQARGSRLLPLYRSPLGPEASAEYREAGLTAAALDLTRFTPGRLARLTRLIERERIDWVHWNFHEPLVNPYLWALSILTPKVGHITTDHVSRPATATPGGSAIKARIKRLLLRRYRSALCVSDFVLDQLRAEGTWRDLRRVTHFVNTRRFAPDPSARDRLRRELGDGDRFVALVIAHLIPEKGVETAIRAFARLPEPSALWIVGAGPESPRLEAEARALGLAGRVRFLGLKRHVEPYLQAADVFVCPSIWAEAAGLVNIEALACGLPVIASEVGGIPEIVDEGRTGYLVPPGDPAALLDRLERLVDDPALRMTLGGNARNEALARFSAEALIPEYLDLYRDLHNRRPAPAFAATH